MESRTRSATETHFEYYFGIESDCELAARYVDFTYAHKDVHSHFFSHILTTAGAEFESVSKAISVVIGEKKPNGIKQIRTLYSPIETQMKSCKLRLLKGDLEISPFKKWEIDSSPSWWKAYNDIKHSRHTHAQSGSLFNALLALGALYFANLVLANNDPEARHQAQKNHQTRLFLLLRFDNETDSKLNRSLSFLNYRSIRWHEELVKRSESYRNQT